MATGTSTLLLRTGSRSIPTRRLCYATFDAKLPSPRVPTEIIDQILDFALLPSFTSPKTLQFASVAPFTLVSADFRQIALRRFFHDIALISTAQWTGLFDLLDAEDKKTKGGTKNGGFAWVTSLSASSKVLSYKPIRLSSLSHLRTLSIDLAQEGLSTQHPFLSSLFGYLEPTNACPNMTSLTLSNLPRVDVLLLRLIVKKFPRLEDLYLSSTERIEFGCCWACFEDSLSCTIHSPIPNEYSDAAGMADAFASALKPLTYLKHLHLGILLSDDQLLYSHLVHSLGDGETLQMVANSIRCKVCFGKAVDTVRLRELAATVIIGQKLKALKTVGWSSFFPGESKQTRVDQHIDSDDTVEEHIEPISISHDEDNSENEYPIDQGADDGDVSDIARDNVMKTTIWILRSNGRIRVRRAPW